MNHRFIVNSDLNLSNLLTKAGETPYSLDKVRFVVSGNECYFEVSDGITLFRISLEVPSTIGIDEGQEIFTGDYHLSKECYKAILKNEVFWLSPENPQISVKAVIYPIEVCKRFPDTNYLFNSIENKVYNSKKIFKVKNLMKLLKCVQTEYVDFHFSEEKDGLIKIMNKETLFGVMAPSKED